MPTSPLENKPAPDSYTHCEESSSACDTRRSSSSAQQVWLAGLGALGRMQSEGSKFFATLVREGEKFEHRHRDELHEKSAKVRATVEDRLDDAVDGARRGWDRLSRALDDRVQAALHALNLPSQTEIQALRHEIHSLRTEIEHLNMRLSAEKSTTIKHPSGPNTTPPSQ